MNKSNVNRWNFHSTKLTNGSSDCLLRPTTLMGGISSFLFVGIVSTGGSGLQGASLRSTTASCVSRSALRCELPRRYTSSLACEFLELRNAWHTSSTMSQTDEHTGSTGTGESSRRSWTWTRKDLESRELVFQLDLKGAISPRRNPSSISHDHPRGFSRNCNSAFISFHRAASQNAEFNDISYDCWRCDDIYSVLQQHCFTWSHAVQICGNLIERTEGWNDFLLVPLRHC